jgi:mannosyl-glycoprotein endo-beta-N-acetylglucosaminidase
MSLDADVTTSSHKTKRLNDIFVGVDVWGRGQHGGGGLGSYKALSHIDPKSLGLSVALFGHGWTWESQQDTPGWDWNTWWAYERLFWVGPTTASERPVVEDVPDRSGMICKHGPYQSVAHFFERSPPPNPISLPFFTSFSPGVGFGWFINGAKVWQTEPVTAGWTDLDKTTSLGNMVWPEPRLSWHEMERPDALPTASATILMEDAWIGGSSLRLSLDVSGTEADDAFFRCVWLPVQSLAITPNRAYTMTLVFKTEFAEDQSSELDVGLSVKMPDTRLEDIVDITSLNEDVNHASGWQNLSIQFTINTGCSTDLLVEAGLVLGLIVADPTQTAQVSIILGSLAVYPSSPISYEKPIHKIIWANFVAEHPKTPFIGILSWEIGVQHDALSNINISSPEDTIPAWRTSHATLSSFLYFNICVNTSLKGEALLPENATFIGTTGLRGQAHRFFVDPACLPAFIADAQTVRFYVQGVTARGVVLPWEQCVFVDVDRS